MADMADDAVALADASGLRNLPLAGISMGGMISQELVLKQPERVSSLTLHVDDARRSGGRSDVAGVRAGDDDPDPKERMRRRRAHVRRAVPHGEPRDDGADRWAR